MDHLTPQDVLLGTVKLPASGDAATTKMLDELEADQEKRQAAYERAMTPPPQDDE
jgi:hypothetical protein